MDSHTPTIRFKKLHPAAHIPTRAHAGDAGADLYSIEELTLEPGQQRWWAPALPSRYHRDQSGLVHPRSGLATKNGITVINTPGTIDAGYRGELKISLVNLD